MSRFYIGQKVVCIKNHSKGVVIKGKYYYINAIKVSCCGDIIVDVGIPHSMTAIKIDTGTIVPSNLGDKFLCEKRKHTIINDGIWWICTTLFAPIEEIPATHEIEINKLLEESLIV